MAYVFYNNNPRNKRVGDCVIRAIGKAVNQNWSDAYIGLCSEGLVFKDMPSSTSRVRIRAECHSLYASLNTRSVQAVRMPLKSLPSLRRIMYQEKILKPSETM